MSTTPRLIHRLAALPLAARWALILAVALTLTALNRWMLVGARQARDTSSLAETAEVIYVPDIRLVRLMTLGYEQAAADLMWVRTLEYFARHFVTDRRYRWLEHFLDQVIELDPKFEKVYHWAGASVLYGQAFTAENIMLSNRFYRRALDANPDDYEAAYRIGLNHYIEMPAALHRAGASRAEQDRERELGLWHLEQAANIPGAPERMRQLVASISSRLGKHQLALAYLVDLYIQTDDPDRKAELQARIDGLRTEGVGAEFAEAAARFEENWKAHFAYIPPAVFALMGEPDGSVTHDVDWRRLLPDVALDAAREDNE